MTIGKGKSLRIVNAVLFLAVLTLLFIHRDRFLAMVHPKADKAVGTAAPELADGTWFNSGPMSLQSLRGKIVVLDFWTFKCGNCIDVLPTINEWNRKYAGKGVVFIGVHTPETDEEADTSSLRTFLHASNIQFPVVTDNGYTTWNRYRVQFWPSTFLIDREGMVRKFHYGELGFSSIEKEIQDLLNPR